MTKHGQGNTKVTCDKCKKIKRIKKMAFFKRKLLCSNCKPDIIRQQYLPRNRVKYSFQQEMFIEIGLDVISQNLISKKHTEKDINNFVDRFRIEETKNENL